MKRAGVSGLHISAVLVLLVICAGGWLRFHRIVAQPIVNDEAFTWQVSSFPLSRLLASVAKDTHPPLHFLLQKSWMAIWGDSLLAIRSLSAVLGACSIFVAYQLCLDLNLLGTNEHPGWPVRRGALIAATLIAIHPEQLDASRVARMYALGVLVTLGACWLFIRAYRSPLPSYRLWIAYGACAAMCCYVHYYALFAVAAQACFVAIQMATSSNRHRDLARPFVGYLIAALLFAAWFPVLLAQHGRVNREFWVPRPTLETYMASFTRWVSGTPFDGYIDFFLSAMVVLVVGILAWRANRLGATVILLQMVVPWVATVAIATSSATSLLQQRYFVFSQASWMLLCGLGCSRLPWLPSALLATVLALQPAIGAWIEHPGDNVVVSSMQHAAQLVSNKSDGASLVVVSHPAALLRLRYYLRQIDRDGIHIVCHCTERSSVGHVNHLAALEAADILSPGPLSKAVRRLCCIADGQTHPTALGLDWKFIHARQFGATTAGLESYLVVAWYHRRADIRRAPDMGD